MRGKHAEGFISGACVTRGIHFPLELFCSAVDKFDNWNPKTSPPGDSARGALEPPKNTRKNSANQSAKCSLNHRPENRPASSEDFGLNKHGVSSTDNHKWSYKNCLKVYADLGKNKLRSSPCDSSKNSESFFKSSLEKDLNKSLLGGGLNKSGFRKSFKIGPEKSLEECLSQGEGAHNTTPEGGGSRRCGRLKPALSTRFATSAVIVVFLAFLGSPPCRTPLEARKNVEICHILSAEHVRLEQTERWKVTGIGGRGWPRAQFTRQRSADLIRGNLPTENDTENSERFSDAWMLRQRNESVEFEDRLGFHPRCPFSSVEDEERKARSSTHFSKHGENLSKFGRLSARASLLRGCGTQENGKPDAENELAAHKFSLQRPQQRLNLRGHFPVGFSAQSSMQCAQQRPKSSKLPEMDHKTSPRSAPSSGDPWVLWGTLFGGSMLPRGGCRCNMVEGAGRIVSGGNIAKLPPPSRGRVPIDGKYKTETSKKYYNNPKGARITKASHFNFQYVLGHKIVFLCVARGNPLPQITWFKDGVELYAHKYMQLHEWTRGHKLKSKMEIDPASQADAGIYECHANNKYAIDSRAFRTTYLAEFN